MSGHGWAEVECTPAVCVLVGTDVFGDLFGVLWDECGHLLAIIFQLCHRLLTHLDWCRWMDGHGQVESAASSSGVAAGMVWQFAQMEVLPSWLLKSANERCSR